MCACGCESLVGPCYILSISFVFIVPFKNRPGNVASHCRPALHSVGPTHASRPIVVVLLYIGLYLLLLILLYRFRIFQFPIHHIHTHSFVLTKINLNMLKTKTEKYTRIFFFLKIYCLWHLSRV